MKIEYNLVSHKRWKRTHIQNTYSIGASCCRWVDCEITGVVKKPLSNKKEITCKHCLKIHSDFEFMGLV